MADFNGYLRDSVLVKPITGGIELQFSIWSIELPFKLFETNNKLAAFFRREIPATELLSEDIKIQNLISVLFNQGCLVPQNAKATYKLQEVKLLYASLCNQAYGDYYSHYLWNVMRDYNISISIIRQWISRTYFLSRFAGVTASVASRNGPTALIKEAFLKSTVEEYSHCNDYYSIPAKLFPCDLGYTYGIEPSAPFVAFDQQMLRIAKQDWLAHLFVALFQERTAQFREEACQLYSQIEDQLGMPRLFDGWRQHISFDEENSHEGDLNQLFDQNLEISRKQLEQSFNEALFTINLLIDGLDEILKGTVGINPRATVGNNFLKISHIQGIQCLEDFSSYRIKSRSPADLASEIVEIIMHSRKGSTFIKESAIFLRKQAKLNIVNLATACLEFCNHHDEIIGLGNILNSSLQCCDEDKGEESVIQKPTRILHNYLSSKINYPNDLAFNFLILFRLTEEGLNISNSTFNISDIRTIANSIETAVKHICKPEMIYVYINQALSLINMIEYSFKFERLKHESSHFKLWHS